VAGQTRKRKLKRAGEERRRENESPERKDKKKKKKKITSRSINRCRNESVFWGHQTYTYRYRSLHEKYSTERKSSWALSQLLSDIRDSLPDGSGGSDAPLVYRDRDEDEVDTTLAEFDVRWGRGLGPNLAVGGLDDPSLGLNGFSPSSFASVGGKDVGGYGGLTVTAGGEGKDEPG